MNAEEFFMVIESIIRGVLVGSMIVCLIELKLAMKEIDLLKEQVNALKKERATE